MAISKGKADGGQGGKRGHSNMDHWEFTEEIKLAAKTEIKLARLEFEIEKSNNRRRQADD